MAGKTVAGILIAGVVLAFIAPHLSWVLNYIAATLLSSLNAFQNVYEALNMTTQSKTVNIGSYSVNVIEPTNTVYKKIEDVLVSVFSTIANVLSNPITFGIIIAITLIIAVLSSSPEPAY